MQKSSLETIDVINLIESFVFLSDKAKSNIKTSIIKEILSLERARKKYILEALFKVFNLFGNFATEELFYNGNITFKGDNEYIYNSLAKNMEDQHELVLLPGCIITKGDNNSYLSLNLPQHNLDSNTDKKFNFNQLIIEAIKPPAISIIINVEYYPNLLKNF